MDKLGLLCNCDCDNPAAIEGAIANMAAAAAVDAAVDVAVAIASAVQNEAAAMKVSD